MNHSGGTFYNLTKFQWNWLISLEDYRWHIHTTSLTMGVHREDAIAAPLILPTSSQSLLLSTNLTDFHYNRIHNPMSLSNELTHSKHKFPEYLDADRCTTLQRARKVWPTAATFWSECIIRYSRLHKTAVGVNSSIRVCPHNIFIG